MTTPRYNLSLCWLRRDLRLSDHAALYHALARSERVLPVFIFDRAILDALPREDRRVEFIWHTLAQLKRQLAADGKDMVVRHALAQDEIPRLARSLGAQAVFANRDYEPTAIARDAAVERTLGQSGIAWHSYKDQVIFERDEVLTQQGKPYTVFTPYKNAWYARLEPAQLGAYPVERRLAQLEKMDPEPLPALTALGFAPTNLIELGVLPGPKGADAALNDFMHRIDDYATARDFPAIRGVSYLSVHLRFGTISVRKLVACAWQRATPGARAWLDELVWREFYQQILYHRPDVVQHAFRAEYDALAYPSDPRWFDAWCYGATGYPIVDAGMRQLNQCGYMHNRLRMITASFLTKHLLVDWRWGEKYFAERLLDYDLSANNGGWQWAASTGCDAQPYFRIFNPVTQSMKFDPEGKFIRRYVPELSVLPTEVLHTPWLATPKQLATASITLGKTYPYPLVDLAAQRQKALALYQRASK